jgi:hypothetical protein
MLTFSGAPQLGQAPGLLALLVAQSQAGCLRQCLAGLQGLVERGGRGDAPQQRSERRSGSGTRRPPASARIIHR